MAVVSRRAVAAAGVVIVALALIGAYRGFRGVVEADVAAANDGLLPTTNAVSARQASPLSEPPPQILSEAQIRTIARQEAQAALGRPATPAAEPSSAPGPAPAPARPAPAPAPAAAPPPPPAPAPAAPPPAEANAPLF